MDSILTGLQLLGFVAVLVGVVLLLPLGAAVLVDGLLLCAAATALEWLSSRRSAPTRPGVE